VREHNKGANSMYTVKAKNQNAKKPGRNVFSWRLKMLTESTRRSGDGRLFQARGAATANERSPSDDVVRGTAAEPDGADVRPALAVAAGRRRDEVGLITWCFAVQVPVNIHAFA